MAHPRFLILLAAAALLAAAGLHVFNVGESRRPEADRFVLERRLAEALAQGKNVLPPPGINEAALRWHEAALLPRPPELAVIGSSHGLLIGDALLGGVRSMNCCISGATLPDHLVTTSLLDEHGRRPRIWLIFVDSWLFDRDTDFGTWHPRADSLRRMETLLADSAKPPLAPVYSPRYSPPAAASWKAPFSIDPLTARLDELLRETFDSVHVIADAKVSPNYVLLADGSYHVPVELARENQAQARRLALQQFATNADRHRYGSFARIDPVLWEFFVRWIDFCRADGAEVWLLFPPYHPDIHPKIVRHPNNRLRAVEQRCREMARARGIPVFGSYAPGPAGVDGSHFSDGDHLTQAGLQRLLAPVVARIAAGRKAAGTPASAKAPAVPAAAPSGSE